MSTEAEEADACVTEAVAAWNEGRKVDARAALIRAPRDFVVDALIRGDVPRSMMSELVVVCSRSDGSSSMVIREVLS